VQFFLRCDAISLPAGTGREGLGKPERTTFHLPLLEKLPPILVYDLSLLAFDLDPTRRSARPINAVLVLGDHALEAALVALGEQALPIGEGFRVAQAIDTPMPSAAYIFNVSRSAFIPPCLPSLRERLPKGEGWLYEVKFDGYRMQVHKAGASARAGFQAAWAACRQVASVAGQRWPPTS